ncbi:dihydrodipicolinate synthase family protein [Pseudovibrio sp. Tun.PSC04-5.I4]|uniref:dihydrodipicolinate synthase family protein n=1 Tax=Pseudovibrio sp. Tun.PSC04-5.I4 TaxID=1798213 RepID=UPI00088FD071|nr:dihydrodipicolinate synthase family protein [Pseudovibrio sp. Tun.PSC04-5.I4]SDR48051.1 4-hydroxy-tetrahydrodipicolinate synthase [Pseudovibrio sp. Tun.PSC04-5.I4]
MTLANLNGILPVLPTPFLPEGGVDLTALKSVVSFALECGVNGVVYPGFASEVEALTGDERAELLKIVVTTVNGRIPIVAGASAPTPEQVIGHGRVAMDLGVNHLMVQPPKELGAENVAAFMAEVSAGLPGVEIILQNAPAPRGDDLSPQTILDILEQVPAVTYVKEETLPAGPAIEHILANAPAHLKGVIGGGGARYILDEYQRGACAAMPAIEIADLHVEMDAAWRCGDRAKARDLYVRTLPLLALQALYRMRLTKHTLMKRGVITHIGVRAPTPNLDKAAVADIDGNLVELGLIPAVALQGAAE